MAKIQTAANTVILRLATGKGGAQRFTAKQTITLHEQECQLHPAVGVTYTSVTVLDLERLKGVDTVIMVTDDDKGSYIRKGVAWTLIDAGQGYPSPLPLPPTPTPFRQDSRPQWLVLKDPRPVAVKRGEWRTTTGRDVIDSLASQQAKFYVERV